MVATTIRGRAKRLVACNKHDWETVKATDDGWTLIRCRRCDSHEYQYDEPPEQEPVATFGPVAP